MRAAPLPMPGTVWGRYPERRERSAAPADFPRERSRFLQGRRYGAFARALAARDLGSLSDARLADAAAAARRRLARDGFADAALAEALSVVGETLARTLGLRPHWVQLFAARAMLDERLAEMATGEGKTLAAALAAATAALARVPVHVITVNDYLAQRDAETLRPLYERLGLALGVVRQGDRFEARRSAYACDVTYCTAKELVFDYLRDSLLRRPALGSLDSRSALRERGTRLRGLCMALIDEADSVLLDEARVPFILSRPREDGETRAHYERALAVAQSLAPSDFVLDRETRSAELTAAGRAKAEAAPGRALWSVRRYREEAVGLGVAALHLFHRDRDYLVRDGEVQIVDATTGRVAPGRAWSRGLHQLIELKEKLSPSRALETAAQITYQSFFARYVRLGGMSGTLTEGRAELARVYGLHVVRVPLRTPSRRIVLPTRVFADASARWAFVLARSRSMSEGGRAVLIGTDSVADSQALSAAMRAAGLHHAVLDARHDQAEAATVAQAGLPGRVTVATSMAGRGTDIALHPDVAANGGLHVMLCQANPSTRIDRQFLGRSARRGEPGSCELLYSADAELMRAWLPHWLRRWITVGGELRPRPFAGLLVRLALGAERRRQEAVRRRLWRQDRDLDRQPILGSSAP